MVASPDAGVCGSKPVRPAARHAKESLANVGNPAEGEQCFDGGPPRRDIPGVRLGVSYSAFDANDRVGWRTFQTGAWNRA